MRNNVTLKYLQKFDEYIVSGGTTYEEINSKKRIYLYGMSGMCKSMF